MSKFIRISYWQMTHVCGEYKSQAVNKVNDWLYFEHYIPFSDIQIQLQIFMQILSIRIIYRSDGNEIYK